ncbi:hypothetical protein GPN2_11696 [Streptomyces murinus]
MYGDARGAGRTGAAPVLPGPGLGGVTRRRRRPGGLPARGGAARAAPRGRDGRRRRGRHADLHRDRAPAGRQRVRGRGGRRCHRTGRTGGPPRGRPVGVRRRSRGQPLGDRVGPARALADRGRASTACGPRCSRAGRAAPGRRRTAARPWRVRRGGRRTAGRGGRQRTRLGRRDTAVRRPHRTPRGTAGTGGGLPAPGARRAAAARPARRRTDRTRQPGGHLGPRGPRPRGTAPGRVGAPGAVRRERVQGRQRPGHRPRGPRPDLGRPGGDGGAGRTVHRPSRTRLGRPGRRRPDRLARRAQLAGDGGPAAQTRRHHTRAPGTGRTGAARRIRLHQRPVVRRRGRRSRPRGDRGATGPVLPDVRPGLRRHPRPVGRRTRPRRPAGHRGSDRTPRPAGRPRLPEPAQRARREPGDARPLPGAAGGVPRLGRPGRTARPPRALRRRQRAPRGPGRHRAHRDGPRRRGPPTGRLGRRRRLPRILGVERIPVRPRAVEPRRGRPGRRPGRSLGVRPRTGRPPGDQPGRHPLALRRRRLPAAARPARGGRRARHRGTGGGPPLGHPRCVGRALRALGTATGGRAGLATVEQAVALLRTAGTDPELIAALAAHGGCSSPPDTSPPPVAPCGRPPGTPSGSAPDAGARWSPHCSPPPEPAGPPPPRPARTPSPAANGGSAHWPRRATPTRRSRPCCTWPCAPWRPI